MKKLVIFAAATMLAVPAIAADAIVYQEPVAVQDYSAFNWSGAYIGAHAGYGWGKTQDVFNSDQSPSKKMKGALGGLQAGYNWQFDNNLVLGAEADVSFSGVKKDWYEKDTGTTDSILNSTYYTKDKIGTHGTLRARLGYAADRFLPYVTGGLAWADMKHTLGCSGVKPINPNAGSCQGTTAKPMFDTTKSKVSVGYAVGAGLEYAVTDNWTVKGEYLYTNLGKKKVTILDPNWPDADGVRNFKTSFNEVRVGVNYKF